MQVLDERVYPTRPFLAVSAAVIRDRRVLIVRRGGNSGRGIYTLPGGVVEAGETLMEAVSVKCARKHRSRSNRWRSRAIAR